MPDIYNMSDVFISYSRRNTEFVQRLFDDLKAEDKEVWADFEDIPKAVDWWREIQAGIDAADAFVFVITPDSVQSEICRKEIEHAVSVNKRFLPVLREEITAREDKEAMHPAISSHNWIFFREGDDYDESFQTLLESIEADLDHNRVLSRLLVRAKDWQENGKRDGYLLQGEDLEQASDWLAEAYQKEPRPTELHIDYIEASRDAQSKRQRRLLTLVSVGFVIAIALAIFAGYQTVLANAAREEAEQNARKAQGLALAASASQALNDNNPDLAIALAEEATVYDTTQPQVYSSVADAAYSPGTRSIVNPGFKLIFSLAYAPDEQTIAVGFETGEVCLRDATTGDSERCLTLESGVIPHEGQVDTLAYSADGSRLMSMSEDAVHIWNMRQGGAEQEAFYPSDQDDEIVFTSAALNNDGTQLLTGDNTGDVLLWDLETDDSPYVFDDVHGESEVTAVAFAPDGERALTGDDEGIIRYLSVGRNRQVLTTLRRHGDAISALAFIPRTNIAISGGADEVMYSWDLREGLPINIFEGHDSSITEILVNPSNQTIFSSSWDNSIREWDFESGRQVRGYYGHSGGINTITLAPDVSQLVSGGYDTDLRFWNVNSFVQEERYTPPIMEPPAATAYGEDAFIAGYVDGQVLVFDRESAQPLAEVDAPSSTSDTSNGDSSKPDTQGVIDVVLMPEGDRYLTLYDHGLIVQRTLTETTPIWDVRLADNESEIQQDVEEVSGRGSVNLNDGAVSDLAIHPDGSEFAVASLDVGVFRYDAVTGEYIGYVPFNTPSDFEVIEYHPDGESIIVGLNDRVFNLHQVDLESGEIIQTFDGHSDGVLSIDFNAENTQMVTGAFDNRMIVWDLEEGDTVRQFEGHSDRVGAVAFNPLDSNQVASVSNDRTMKLWNLQTGFEIFTYEGHTERVIDVHFSVDGENILTASTDGSLILWREPQPLNDLLVWINENRYVRDLTCFEQEQYLGADVDCDADGSGGE